MSDPTPPSTRRPRSRARVVIISGHAPPVLDGVGDGTARLVEELARQRPGWHWTWQTRRPGWRRSPIVLGPGYRLIRPNRAWDEPGIRLACWTLRRLRPDVVHIQDQIHSFYESDAAPRLAEAAGCPVVTTLHEYHVELPSVVHTDALVRRSTAVIANDARNAARCLERTGRDPQRWWSGPTLPAAAPGVSFAREPDLVSTFGFLTALKSIEPPLGGIARLQGRGAGLRWRIVGPFDPAGNPAHARLAEVAEGRRVEFTGAVEWARVRELLAPSRAMILPYADGASLRRGTLQVAWALGLPVVTTPPTVPEPAIVDGENCLLVREATPEAWEAAIASILDDPGLEAALAAGSLRAAEAFGWPRLARLHLDLYDRILEGTSVGGRP